MEVGLGFDSGPMCGNWTKKLLELRIKFSKVAGYNINIQKSIVFIEMKIEQSKIKIKKTIPFTVASKTIKHFGINLTKEVEV